MLLALAILLVLPLLVCQPDTGLCVLLVVLLLLPLLVCEPSTGLCMVIAVAVPLLLPLLVYELGTSLTTTYCAFFAKGQTKNLKGLRRKNKKLEGFAKEKKSGKFVMRYASQLVVHHSSQIDNEPLIITAFLRDTRQTKLCDPLNLCAP